MGFYLSAGVYVRERDISNIIPNVSSTTGAIVGYSTKGDVNEAKLITNTQQFIEEYGEPVPGQYFHYSALAFLLNGNALYCKRVHNGSLYGGIKVMQLGGVGTPGGIAGFSAPTFQEDSFEDILFYVFAKDPGTWNNSLRVSVKNSNATEYTFDIVVSEVDTDGNLTTVESWTVSRQTKLDGFGRQLYLEEKINGYSKYIVVADSPLADTEMPGELVTPVAMTGGTNGNAITDSEVILGWDAFLNPDEVDVRILINGGYASVAVHNKLNNICLSRRDCIAVLDVPYDAISSVNNIVNWRRTTQNINSNYVALYAPWVKAYDSFNDRIIELPPSGYVASMFAYNDYIADPWAAPAGFNRGLLSVLGFTSVFTQGERDTLYSNQINPLQTFRGEGNVIWGQKTQQVKASALDRVNVRRSLIVIEKAMATQLRSFAFEPNNEVTRFRVTATMEEYLDRLAARGAFQTELGDKGYRVVCDETNNTPAVIDANELHVDVFIKPVRSAEYIQLQTIITQTGASFDELISRGTLF
jgi:hypothetical protein